MTTQVRDKVTDRVVHCFRVYDFAGRRHRSSVWANYPHGLQTVGARMKSALRRKYSVQLFEDLEAGVMRPDLSEGPTVTLTDLMVVVRRLFNHLCPTEGPLRNRLNSRLVGWVRATLGVCQDGRHPNSRNHPHSFAKTGRQAEPAAP